MREVVLPEETAMAQAQKEAAVTEARRRGALPNPLTRHSGKVSQFQCFFLLHVFFLVLPKTEK